MDTNAANNTSSESGAFPPPATSSLLGSPDVPAPSTDTSTPPADDNNSTETSTVSSSSGGGGRRRSVFMIGILVLFLVVGVISGTILLSRGTFETTVAWDCELYQFDVNESGAVTVQNGSNRNLPSQVATVHVDDEVVGEFEVNALDAGDGESLGVVPIPDDGSFSWRVVGNKDCDQTGSHLPDATAQCVNIKAFDEEWNPLTIQDISTFQPGDTIRFSIAGQATEGEFLGARFSINGETRDPVTQLRPNTNEFYDEYILPEDVTSFNVTVELLHSEAGWF